MDNPFFSLHDRWALVTGAGSGIGEAIARRFAKAGAHVYVADVQPAVESVAASVREAGGSAEAVQLDVSDEAACRSLADQILAKRPAGLDILVNNAGIGHVGTIEKTTGDDLDRLYRVNVRGVFNMCKAFIGPMLARKRGNIINMASIGGLLGVYDRVAYCTSKFAVVGMTKAMALDHARDGIRINCICPARVYTPFVDRNLKNYPDPEKAFRDMSNTQPVGRMGTPEEIAAAAHYLASDESSFVTGTGFVIDGGFSAGK